jgi:hypothetical protein
MFFRNFIMTQTYKLTETYKNLSYHTSWQCRHVSHHDMIFVLSFTEIGKLLVITSTCVFESEDGRRQMPILLSELRY